MRVSQLSIDVLMAVGEGIGVEGIGICVGIAVGDTAIVVVGINVKVGAGV